MLYLSEIAILIAFVSYWMQSPFPLWVKFEGLFKKQAPQFLQRKPFNCYICTAFWLGIFAIPLVDLQICFLLPIFTTVIAKALKLFFEYERGN